MAVTFWRSAADVSDILAGPPEPVFDSSIDEKNFDPVPCLVHPERVTEYPDAVDLPAELRERVQECSSRGPASANQAVTTWSPVSDQAPDTTLPAITMFA